MRNFRCTIWSSNIKYNCIRHVMMYSTVLSVVALIDVVTIDAVEWWIAKQLAGWRVTLFFFSLKKWECFSCFLFLCISSVHSLLPYPAMPCHTMLSFKIDYLHIYLFFSSSHFVVDETSSRSRVPCIYRFLRDGFLFVFIMIFYVLRFRMLEFKLMQLATSV